MGLPSKKRTNRSKRDRASHFALKPLTLGKCPECGSPVKTHYACPKCGLYRGKQGKEVKKRADRLLRKPKA
ncbi:MAG: 50S ribosomal protein L32 [Patescibacteria group bacterium]